MGKHRKYKQTGYRLQHEASTVNRAGKEYPAESFWISVPASVGRELGGKGVRLKFSRGPNGELVYTPIKADLLIDWEQVGEE